MVLLDQFKIDIGLVIKPLLYIIIGFITYIIIKNTLNHAEKKSSINKKHHQKRLTTINILVQNIIKYIIIIFVVIAILSTFGINVKSILAGIGITAAILGLAFQDIAKDFLAGISIVLEDQFEIGDTIQIGEFMGEVVSFGLRTTRIKDYKGATKIIANHTITELINYNLYNNLAIVDISIDYSEDLDKVEKVLKEMAEDELIKIPKAKGKIQVLGIHELDSSSIVYRLAVEVNRAEYKEAERVLRKEVVKTLTKANIKIPYQQIEVHNGNK